MDPWWDTRESDHPLIADKFRHSDIRCSSTIRNSPTVFRLVRQGKLTITVGPCQDCESTPETCSVQGQKISLDPNAELRKMGKRNTPTTAGHRVTKQKLARTRSSSSLGRKSTPTSTGLVTDEDAPDMTDLPSDPVGELAVGVTMTHIA